MKLGLPVFHPQCGKALAPREELPCAPYPFRRSWAALVPRPPHQVPPLPLTGRPVRVCALPKPRLPARSNPVSASKIGRRSGPGRVSVPGYVSRRADGWEQLGPREGRGRGGWRRPEVALFLSSVRATRPRGLGPHPRFCVTTLGQALGAAIVLRGGV